MTNIYFDKVIQTNKSFINLITGKIIRGMKESDNIEELQSILVDSGDPFYAESEKTLFYLFDEDAYDNLENKYFDINLYQHLHYELNFDTKELFLFGLAVESESIIINFNSQETFISHIDPYRESCYTFLEFSHEKNKTIKLNEMYKKSSVHKDSSIEDSIYDFYCDMIKIAAKNPKEVTDFIFLKQPFSQETKDMAQLKFDIDLEYSKEKTDNITFNLNKLKII